MNKYPIHPVAAIRSLYIHRHLVVTLVRRDMAARYRGSIFGILWALFNPLLMLVVYTFVFSVIFKARWGGGGDSKTEFALLLFLGLIVFNIFSECVSKAPATIVSNGNYVKKVIFPLEILPWVNIFVALVNALISLSVWIVAFIFLFGIPSPYLLMLPLVILPLVLFIMGLSWCLASLGVYIRDVSQLVSIVVTVTMFLSPIFYPISALPERFQSIVLLNPLATVIEQMRQILFWRQPTDLTYYWLELLGSAIVAWLGFAWFQKTRKGFADVL
ncbi:MULTISPECIES: ABC transporter permease [unclassified Rhizobium]|jgi:lipopolysaccharide transport system permease protein|uniref:ABC transporter permease n=1 Tax=unclassified Rhizobium TaxID=2613769 RepID=UPI000648C49E|nr:MULTISPECIES: ABC transporter permease [unclassified Rhizobium]OJY71367.1 MAG: sugar ABC transporter permease [Rhizobium sp. 60-20]